MSWSEIRGWFFILMLIPMCLSIFFIQKDYFKLIFGIIWGIELLIMIIEIIFRLKERSKKSKDAEALEDANVGESEE